MYRERPEDRRWSFEAHGYLRGEQKKEQMRNLRWNGWKVRTKIRPMETKERILRGK